MEQLAHFVELSATGMKLIFEIGSILVVAVGGIVILLNLVTSRPKSRWLDTMRQTFARYLLVALELQLAADIIGTAVAPSWEQLGKLAAIAVIRTFLNYFLVEESQVGPSAIPKQDETRQEARS